MFIECLRATIFLLSNSFLPRLTCIKEERGVKWASDDPQWVNENEMLYTYFISTHGLGKPRIV